MTSCRRAGEIPPIQGTREKTPVPVPEPIPVKEREEMTFTKHGVTVMKEQILVVEIFMALLIHYREK